MYPLRYQQTTFKVLVARYKKSKCTHPAKATPVSANGYVKKHVKLKNDGNAVVRSILMFWYFYFVCPRNLCTQ